MKTTTNVLLLKLKGKSILRSSLMKYIKFHSGFLLPKFENLKYIKKRKDLKNSFFLYKMKYWHKVSIAEFRKNISFIFI